MFVNEKKKSSQSPKKLPKTPTYLKTEENPKLPLENQLCNPKLSS